MSEQNETPIHILSTAVAAEVAVGPRAADRLYHLVALTAGLVLLGSLL